MATKVTFYILTLGAFFILSIFSSYTEAPKEEQRPPHTLPQIIKSVNIDHTFTFASEKVPTEIFDVKERLDRELLVNSYWHSNTVQNIKLANRYFPVIERILAQNGVPDDFKYLAVAESGLRNVSSPAGAKGIWQFLKSTAKDYKLEVNSEVDERYHIEKATEAACKYLIKQKNKFGTWTMAAASYNMGSTGLQNELTNQKGNTYYDLNLNQETSRYIFRIIAMKEIISNPEKYGFQIYQEDKYPGLDNHIHISVEESNVQWSEFAERNGITYRILKVYNPWLVSSKLTNSSKKNYLIKIPKR